MGGVAYLSLEDSEVCLTFYDELDLLQIVDLFIYPTPILGAVQWWDQISRNATYETVPRYGTTLGRRKNSGGACSSLCYPQVSNFQNIVGADMTNQFFPHSYQPAPFFVLDEVDAALDNTNVAKIANYIRGHASDDFQFIVISLKGSLYERGHSLVGIYRDQEVNSSRTLTLDVSD